MFKSSTALTVDNPLSIFQFVIDILCWKDVGQPGLFYLRVLDHTFQSRVRERDRVAIR